MKLETDSFCSEGNLVVHVSSATAFRKYYFPLPPYQQGESRVDRAKFDSACRAEARRQFKQGIGLLVSPKYR